MEPILKFITNSIQPLNIAHRGGMALYPENTLTGFHASVAEHQADMLEMDLRITQEGRAVVFHDHTLERTTNGKGRVCNLSYREISELDAGFHFTDSGNDRKFRGKGMKIPLLEDVFEQITETYINLELKDHHPELISEVLRVVKKFEVQDRILIGSGHFFQNRIVHRVLSDCGRYLSKPDIYLFGFLGSLGFGRKYWQNFHVAEVPLHYHGYHVYPMMKKAAEKMNLPLFVWGANDLQSIEKLKADGVDGIITDRPDLM